MVMPAELLAELARLDHAGEPLAALQRVAAADLGYADIIQVLGGLYQQRLDATAYLLAGKLIELGVEHWMLDLARAHVATLANLDEVAGPATRRLGERMATLDPDALAACRRALSARLGTDTLLTGGAGDADLALRTLDLAKLAQPVLAELFPGPVTPGQVAASPAARVPDQPPKSMRMAFGFAETPRRRTAVVAMRHRWHSGEPGSRRFDLGARFVAAMTRYGWDARLYGIRNFYKPEVVAADCAAIAALCEETRADVLVMDEPRLDLVGPEIMSGFLARLRQRLPDLSIIAMYLDPWEKGRWPAMRRTAPLVDLMWAPLPSLDIWRGPEFVGKTVLCPIPCGEPRLYAPPPGGLRVSFVGGLDRVNWARSYWLAALSAAGADLRRVITDRMEDGLPILESHELYMDTLGASGCSLNFSIRSDGARTLTGRTFEVPWTGALLIHEADSDTDHYFTPWEHYLKFSTFPELVEIIALIRDRPDLAEEIRQRGHAFATATYSEERIIGHLDWRLDQCAPRSPPHP